MNITLKQCPCCGGEAEAYSSAYDYSFGKSYIIRCTALGCHIQTPECDAMCDAIEIWNTRKGNNATDK